MTHALGFDFGTPALLRGLVENVRSHGNHTTTGEIGLRFLLEALSQGGRADVVYEMISRTNAPSYGYQVRHGATSLTEAWDADPRESQDHFMLGHVEEWFYQVLAGINPDPDTQAFGQIIIKPQPVGDLTWCQGSYRSPRGSIISEWKIVGGDLHLDVEIPANTSATVFVPATNSARITESGRPVGASQSVKFLRMEGGAAVFQIGSGRYQFLSQAFRPAA